MQVDREEFRALLLRLKPALRVGGAIPSMSHFWFDGKGVSAYDGGFGLRLSYQSELTCGVPGAALLGLLDTSVLKEAKLEQTKSSLNVSLGRSTSKLAVLDSDAQLWPFPKRLPKGAETYALSEVFIEGLRKVLFVKASPTTRVEHYGVIAECVDDRVFLYTTDTMTLASASLELEGSFGKVLLPRLFAEQLVSQSPGGVDLTVLDGCLIAVGDDAVYYSSLMDISTADDLGKVIASQQAAHSKPVPIPAGLDGALARAEVLSGKEDAVVALTLSKGLLTVSGEYKLGELCEELELEGNPGAAKILVKAPQIRRALVHAESLSITSKTVLLRGEPDFLYLVAALPS